jgi:hypothetical protein
LSKRSKKNRSAKLSIPSQAVKRGTPRFAAVAFLAIAIPLSLGFWWWNSRSTANHPQFEKIIGPWQRPDGGYIVEIKSIAEDGTMNAAYFNPKSIHVGKAEASRHGDATKVFIELRDVNYPGSTYTLTYEPASDQLKGLYYQAVEKQRFEVAFARVQ